MYRRLISLIKSLSRLGYTDPTPPGRPAPRFVTDVFDQLRHSVAPSLPRLTGDKVCAIKHSSVNIALEQATKVIRSGPFKHVLSVDDGTV